MAGSIKSILNVVVVIGLVLWLLDVVGLFHSLPRSHGGGCERALVNEKEKEPHIVWHMGVWPRLFADRPPGSQEVNDE